MVNTYASIQCLLVLVWVAFLLLLPLHRHLLRVALILILPHRHLQISFRKYRQGIRSILASTFDHHLHINIGS